MIEDVEFIVHWYIAAILKVILSAKLIQMT